MKPNSYPPQDVPAWTPINVRQLLPVYPPPEPLDLPALPTKQRTPSFTSPYAISTHIIPACYLRRGRFGDVPPAPPTNVSKEERAKILKSYVHDLVIDKGFMMSDGYPKVYWNVLNRYVRRGLSASNRTGLTLFFAHANGFPKEASVVTASLIWEPALDKILNSPANTIIDEVWCWESIQHGDAALINRESISKYFDWTDNTRDIVNFLTNFLPSEADASPLPLHLPRLPEAVSLHRREHGFEHRRVFATGHSYGGCTSLIAAQNFPKLFDSLILIDPVIPRPSVPLNVLEAADGRTNALLVGSLTRRDTWATREEVLTSYLKNPFFAAWHPAVLRVYIEAGIYDTTDSNGNPIVKLKMPGMYESIVFAERYAGVEAWQRLPELDERIKLRWLVPGNKEADEFGPPGTTAERVWLRKKNASNWTVPGAGHLIPQERPIEVAEDITEFILETYSSLKPTSPPRASL